MHGWIDPNARRPRVVIDCDPGIDDVVALALALRSPELDVAAVVTTYGNAALADTTRNARHLLDLVGAPTIPVIPGSDKPLERAQFFAADAHGPRGVGYASVLEAPPCPPQPLALLELLDRTAAPVVLVTLGPLTDLAHALIEDADLVRSRVIRHLGMFGSLEQRGGTGRLADFNAWCDPEALAIVLAGDLPVTMVGLDVTRRMHLTRTEVGRVSSGATDLDRWLGAALRYYLEFHHGQGRRDTCVINDVLPIGQLIEPRLLQMERRRLVVDLDGGERRGHTRVDGGGWDTAVATDVDIGAMRTLLGRVFTGPWSDTR